MKTLTEVRLCVCVCFMAIVNDNSYNENFMMLEKLINTEHLPKSPKYKII